MGKAAPHESEMKPPAREGIIFIVGAGPGDPGLITFRGLECLRSADLVLYDYLVNRAILEHVSEQAEAVCLGRHGQGRIMPQEEINQRMIAAACEGKRVVRLKSGDPAIFARVAEEIGVLKHANVRYEVVPGITAALAAGSYAGVTLTHREAASAVALVTAHESSQKTEANLDYRGLAQFPGTLVFYMGVTTANSWTQKLIEAGMPAETPAAVIRRCSWPNQETFYCTLGTVGDELTARRLRPPAIIIVGYVANIPAQANWFTSRPLFKQRILITRPRHQTLELRNRLSNLGADVVVQPAIEIGPPKEWSDVDRAIGGLASYDWLVFSSANGVRRFIHRLWESGHDLRSLRAIKLASIGSATSEELASHHLRVDIQPKDFRAESLAECLVGEAKGRRFLLVRASRGREVLAEELRSAGAVVDQIVVYKSSDVERADPEIHELLKNGQIQWTTVTSSAIARSLACMFGSDLRKTRLASISPVTSQTLRELGYSPSCEATVYTMDGLVDAVLAAQAEVA